MIKSINKSVVLFVILFITYLPLFNYYSVLNKNNGHSFMTADWLINYNFGYVNRGLFGTILINLFSNSKNMLNFLTIVLILIYLLIFYFLCKTFQSNKQNFISYVLIFSPTTFLFNIYDSQGAFRKEILGILVVFIISSINTQKRIRLLYFGSLVYTLAIFSHPVNLFFISTILYLLFFHLKTRKINHYLIYIIPVLFNFIFHFLFSGSEQELVQKRNGMCEQLSMLELSNLCGFGSFDFLVYDLNANYLITQDYIINQNREASYVYIFLFIISLIPYFFEKNLSRFIAPMIIIGITFFPLFLLGYDWGRWIYMISICFLTIYLVSNKKAVNSSLIYILTLFPILFKIEHCCSPILEISIYSLNENFLYLFTNFSNIFKIISIN